MPPCHREHVNRQAIIEMVRLTHDFDPNAPPDPSQPPAWPAGKAQVDDRSHETWPWTPHATVCKPGSRCRSALWSQLCPRRSRQRRIGRPTRTICGITTYLDASDGTCCRPRRPFSSPKTRRRLECVHHRTVLKSALYRRTRPQPPLFVRRQTDGLPQRSDFFLKKS